MILRSLALVGGLAGAVTTSQFPEFSQQYTQRLGGAVDALEQVVADFDASAAASDLTREDALAQMQGTPFLERRRADMTRSITRYARLSADLETLEGHGPFMRAYNAARFTDTQIAQVGWWRDRRAVASFARALQVATGKETQPVIPYCQPLTARAQSLNLRRTCSS
jgi:hypothetical protein